jgi:hypothetical protein
MANVPLVYHDSEKELLLTFFPPDLGVPVNEQEKQIGPIIQKVLNDLPPERRKAYLFQPQTMLTLQSMLERILEGDGITKEMIQEQQEMMQLLQRLASAEPEKRSEIIKQEEEKINELFFSLLNQLIEVSLMQGEKQSAEQLALISRQLLEETEIGRKIAKEAKEAQDAAKTLEKLAKDGLTREKLLDLVIRTTDEVRLEVYARMTYSMMDYEFFQKLTSNIDKSQGKQKAKLESIRDQLLQLTAEIRQEMEEVAQANIALLNNILQADDVEAAAEKALPSVSPVFVEILQGELEKARQQGDLELSGKLNQVMAVVQKASAPPPEVQLIEEMVNLESEEALDALLEERADEITDEFLQMFNSVISHYSNEEGAEEVTQKLQEVYRKILRFTMARNLKSD